MKKFFLLIGLIATTFLISCSNNEINFNDKDIIESIVPTINDTYKNIQLLVDDRIANNEFGKIFNESYENDLESFEENNDNIELIWDEKLKKDIEEYYIGEENRSEAYNEFKDANTENFEEILNEADEKIYPTIKSFIEEFKIKFNNEIDEEYELIKSKLDQ